MLLVLLLLLPGFAGDFALVVAVDILIMGLFAASLQAMLGPGGMISFGHAAFFGAGAYAAALLVRHAEAPMHLALPAAPLAAGALALIVGWFCIRLSGVYLAMLTLAFAQIAWSVVQQWRGVTGGDDGILGVWPPAWAADRTAFYYMVLACTLLGLLALRHSLFSPFGRSLRAARDSPLRAEAIGIDVQRVRWLGFTLAGTAAGLAGGLYAYAKGSVFPDEMAIPRSVDALLMVLLGGVQSLEGPIIGAAALIGLQEAFSRLEFWRLFLGLSIILLCIVFPHGLAGLLERTRGRPGGTG
jgi:branched-chain amino acid transport system permease protein